MCKDQARCTCLMTDEIIDAAEGLPVKNPVANGTHMYRGSVTAKFPCPALVNDRRAQLRSEYRSIDVLGVNVSRIHSYEAYHASA
jgi:hypothetical protein